MLFYYRQRRKSGRAPTGGESNPPSPAASVASSSAATDIADSAEADEWRRLLDDLKEHRNSSCFAPAEPTSPGAATVVLNPMDLNAVRSAVDSGAVKTTAEFLRNVALVFLNVTMTHSSNSEVHASSIH